MAVTVVVTSNSAKQAPVLGSSVASTTPLPVRFARATWE
jgi:hypothetical protein